ncbi:hypothetical protein HLH26_12795 [Gluconacetobacter sp. 1b LMG 1731]|uniref:Uncharacterized protein n=1 Tax=Gluconacetobacter dulcium TaxID=2729096 RepID=A0A7W4IM24_9PROT|nr:hypothetical protein [Gluconacetobacter dulcium]MBB2165395.1 hypothetical protein [Gluconacetobacter dulcium]MBB2194438.1 hypothetical protein [Gluconacetobacter dulcium]
MKSVVVFAMVGSALSGCTHPTARHDDPRAVLFRHVGGDPSLDGAAYKPDDGKMHGRVTVGVGASPRQGRGAVPMSSADITNVLPGLSIGETSWGR